MSQTILLCPKNIPISTPSTLTPIDPHTLMSVYIQLNRNQSNYIKITALHLNKYTSQINYTKPNTTSLSPNQIEGQSRGIAPLLSFLWKWSDYVVVVVVLVVVKS